MSKKFCQIFIVYSTYRNVQHLMDIQYKLHSTIERKKKLLSYQALQKQRKRNPTKTTMAVYCMHLKEPSVLHNYQIDSPGTVRVQNCSFCINCIFCFSDQFSSPIFAELFFTIFFLSHVLLAPSPYYKRGQNLGLLLRNHDLNSSLFLQEMRKFLSNSLGEKKVDDIPQCFLYSYYFQNINAMHNCFLYKELTLYEDLSYNNMDLT